jgi:hypothetical protein
MSDPQPPATTAAADPEPQNLKNPLRKTRQCQYIRAGGERCRANALTGSHYCHSHKYNRKPSLTGVKGYDRVGFLEDTASIQLCCSQILQGVFDRTVDNATARTSFYGLSVATSALRDLRAHERWLAQNKLPLPEQVSETVREDGEEMAPEKEYRGPSGTFEPQWSVSKYMYEQQCEKAGIPKPTCADDFPESGWLTEDEVTEDPHEFAERYRARLKEIDRLRKEFEDAVAALNEGPTSKPKPKEAAIETDEDEDPVPEPAPSTAPDSTNDSAPSSTGGLDLNAATEVPVPGARQPLPGKAQPMAHNPAAPVLKKRHYYRKSSKQTTSQPQTHPHPGPVMAAASDGDSRPGQCPC